MDYPLPKPCQSIIPLSSPIKRTSDIIITNWKCIYSNTIAIKNILETPHPKWVKEIGDSITTNLRWHKMTQSVDYGISWANAKQCTLNKTAILAANGKEIIEDAWYPYWGQCSYGNGRNVTGKNNNNIIIIMCLSSVTTISLTITLYRLSIIQHLYISHS